MPKKSRARKSGKESHSRQHGARKPARGKIPGGARISGEKNPQSFPADVGKSKDGCFPKLSMVLLPFLAGGIFLILRS
jgi:hypothetical protein